MSQLDSKSALRNYASRLDHTVTDKGGGPNIGYPGPTEGNSGDRLTRDNEAEAQIAAEWADDNPTFADFPTNR